MPKPRWKLNTIYISERLQESLRPISRCTMTTVVAPMGYGKTTAVNWYLEERAKAETLKIIRISVYSDNLAIFWKSVQEAFARAGFPFLREYPCPTDAAGGGLMVDDLCHELAGETSCYISIALSMPTYGIVGCEKGYLLFDNFPRCDFAIAHFNADRHEERIEAGERPKALLYEKEDFERLVREGTPDPAMSMTHDVVRLIEETLKKVPK